MKYRDFKKAFLVLALFSLFYSVEGISAEQLKPKLLNPNHEKLKGIVLSITKEFISDEELRAKQNKRTRLIPGREEEADSVLDTLVRLKGAVPILLGPPGAGKTTIVQRAVQKAVAGEYPQEDAFTTVFKDAVWIETSPALISSLAKSNSKSDRREAMETTVGGIFELEKKLNIKIILFIDEIHTLDSAQVEALLTYMDSSTHPLRIIGASNSDKFQLAFKENDAFLRRVRPIGVEEFSFEQTVSTLKTAWLPLIQERYGVEWTEESIQAAAKVGPILLREAGRFDSTLKVLQDVSIATLRNPEHSRVISEKDVYQHFQKVTGYPVIPHNAHALVNYIENLKKQVSEEIKGQPRMIGDVLKLFQDTILGSKKNIGVGLIVGPQGVGKSELGKALAQFAFNNPRAYLNMDMNDYKAGKHSLTKAFGAEGGLVTSDTRSGVLCNFFDDPSAGKFGGIIVIEQAEKGHIDFWERMSEFLDTGSFVGADGIRRYAHNHLVLITSNRGDRHLFPLSVAQWSENEIQKKTDSITEKNIKDLFTQKLSGTDQFKLPTSILDRVDLFTVGRPMNVQATYEVLEKEGRSFEKETLGNYGFPLEIDTEIFQYFSQSSANVVVDGVRAPIRQLNRFLKESVTQAIVHFSEEEGETSTRKSLEVLRFQIRFQEETPVLEARQGEKLLVLPLPQQVSLDPLEDSELLEKLSHLKETMEARVTGQDDAIRSIVRSIYSHFASPTSSSLPVSVFMIGPTGIGKTEIAKALAQGLYGREERVGIIPLGHIHDTAKMNQVFGSDPGYIGSDTTREFENILISNPEGGVILFDEASNLGGNSPEKKDELFKTFYHILDEGKWTSPVTGVEYSLGKFIFLFTGNDGQEVVADLSHEDLRQAQWEKYKGREAVKAILTKNHVPEAFLGRLADAIFLKPLTVKDAQNVTLKHLTPIEKNAEKRGFLIEYDEGFISQFSKTFFSQKTGGRSIRSVLKDRVEGLMNELMVTEKLKGGLQKGQIRGLRFQLEDNLPAYPYLRSEDPQRKVVFKIVDEMTRTVLIEEDLTEFATTVKRMPYEAARTTAYHEAGHAVVNLPEFSGQNLEFITIMGADGKLGYARYISNPHLQSGVMTRKNVIHDMARNLAGMRAQVKAGYSEDSGWSSDLESMRKLGTDFLIKWGMLSTGPGMILNAEGKPEPTPHQLRAIEKELNAMIQEAGVLVDQILTEQWALVEKVVENLLENGTMTGEVFAQLKKEVNQEKGTESEKGSAPDMTACRLFHSQ